MILSSTLIAIFVAIVISFVLKHFNLIHFGTQGINPFWFLIPLGTIDAVEELTINFNKMAAELESVEMLQSDFINNFSHEFKTPIVSIRGFAKMLKRDDLTAEERAESLEIIITESERLAELSTKVLNLSKIERAESNLCSYAF